MEFAHQKEDIENDEKGLLILDKLDKKFKNKIFKDYYGKILNE